MPQVLDSERTTLVTLTREGQSLLERHQHRSDENPARRTTRA